MAQNNILLEEEDDIDENLLFLNFFQGNLQYLKQVSLYDIPNHIKYETAALYFVNGENDHEWIGFLEDLGVDKITMHDIEFKSSKGILPIYFALRKVLPGNKSFGDFINVLCKREKFHILRHLKPFVEELLSKKHSLIKERSYFAPPAASAPEFPLLEITSSSADVHESGVNIQHDSGYSSKTYQEIEEKHVNDNKKALDHFQNSEAIPIDNNKRLSAVSFSQNVISIISVFIMHSMLDKKYAKKLAVCLKEKGFKVITSANIYPFLRENPTMMMKAIDEKVDFVIPIISESFMKQIQHTDYSATLERDIESIANTFMYDRLLNEYSGRSNFFNRRVKPVCYSLESRKLDNRDQILAWSSYLPFAYLQNDQILEKELLRLLRHSKKHLDRFK